MKYFCISDIHGHYEEMMDALDTSGFDSSNADHMLVVNGDIVDRGPNCVEVLEYELVKLVVAFLLLELVGGNCSHSRLGLLQRM